MAATWEDMKARLSELVAEKLSGSQIATTLNQQFKTDLSRSAVMGACHRHGLSLAKPPGFKGSVAVAKRAALPAKAGGPSKPKAPRKNVVDERAPAPAPIAFPMHDFEPIEPTPELTYDGVRLLDARLDQCRWIEGDASTMFCCGVKVAFKSSWCATHHARVYEPRSRAPRAYSLDESRREQMRRDLTKVGAR